MENNKQIHLEKIEAMVYGIIDSYRRYLEDEGFIDDLKQELCKRFDAIRQETKTTQQIEKEEIINQTPKQQEQIEGMIYSVINEYQHYDGNPANKIRERLREEFKLIGEKQNDESRKR